MVNAKTLISIQTLLLLSQCISGQQLTPNASLYLPGGSSPSATTDAGEFLFASQISVSGSTTFYVVVDADPAISATATITVGSSPSGASLHGVVIGPGGEEDLDETCKFSGGNSTCEVDIVAKVINDTTTITISATSTFTESITSLPVIALNFQQTASPTPTSPPSANNTTPTGAAVALPISVGLTTIITLASCFFKLL